MDGGTALAKQPRLRPLWRVVAAAHLQRSTRRRWPPRGDWERSGSHFSQSGFARKPLNGLDLRKQEAWISLPLALTLLPNDLDFPSPGFENPCTLPSTHIQCVIASLPLAFIELRAAAEATFCAKEAPEPQGACFSAARGGGLRPVRDYLHVDVAARGVAVGADLSRAPLPPATEAPPAAGSHRSRRAPPRGQSRLFRAARC